MVGSDAVCANWSGGVANLKKPRGTGWRPSGTNCPPFKQTKRLTKPGIDPSMPAEAGVRLDTGLPLRNEAGLRSTQDMTRHVKIGEAKTHLSALLAEVEAGEDLVICRGQTPIARVTRDQWRTGPCRAVRDPAPGTVQAAGRDDVRDPVLAP